MYARHSYYFLFRTISWDWGTPKASMFMGKNKPDIAERILGTCTFGLIVVSVILTAIGMIFS